MAESDDDTSDGGRFSYHSEELRGPISSSDEENESVRVIYPQFNAEAQFGEVIYPVVAVKNIVVSLELVDPMKAYNNTRESTSMRLMPTLGLSRGSRNEGPST